MKLFCFFIIMLIACTKESPANSDDEKLAENTDDRPFVILISLDGFRYDYFSKTQTPNFDKLIQNGVKANSLISTFPSYTFPNHYSIVTGLHAGNHGIVNNSFYDSNMDDWYSKSDPNDVQNPKWYNGEAIWTTAIKNNMKSASMFWVGSEATGKTPTYYKEYDGSFSNSARINQVINWLKMPEEDRPQMITLYFSDTDGAGHTYGPDSDEVINAIKTLDSDIGYLLSQLELLEHIENINLIIVSDHGMTELSDMKRISGDSLGGIIDSFGLTRGGYGPFMGVYSGNEDELDSLYTRLKQNETHFRVLNQQELMDEYSYNYDGRTAKLLILANDGYSISDRSLIAGQHGYDPNDIAMGGIFVASGPAFKSGLIIDGFQNIHIYPIITELLNISYNHTIDGVNQIANQILK